MEDSSSSKDLNYLPRFQKGKKKKKETNKQKSQMKTNKQTKTQNQPIKKKNRSLKKQGQSKHESYTLLPRCCYCFPVRLGTW